MQQKQNSWRGKPHVLAMFQVFPGDFLNFEVAKPPICGDPIVSEQVLQAPCMSRSYDGRHAMQAMQAMPAGAG